MPESAMHRIYGYDRPKKVLDLPAETFFGALVEEYYSHDDGYGGQSTGYELKLLTFESDLEMEKWATTELQRGYGKKTFKLVRVNPINLEIKAVLNIKE